MQTNDHDEQFHIASTTRLPCLNFHSCILCIITNDNTKKTSELDSQCNVMITLRVPGPCRNEIAEFW